jgi:hypothetical protein
MSELAQKIGQSSGEKNKPVKSQGNANNPGIEAQNSQEKQAVRDITREQWFWDTAVLS